MSMLEIQRTTLNDFGNSQPAFKPFGQLTGKPSDDIKLGNLISGDGLVDEIKNLYFTEYFKLPAPAASLKYQYMPIFKSPCDGFLTKVDLYCYDVLVPGGSFTAGTTANQNYRAAVIKYFSNFNSYQNAGIDLLTGMNNNTSVPVPVSFDVPLMKSGCEYTLNAVGADIEFIATTEFQNLPSVNDYINFTINGTSFVGANLVNVGIYKVTEVTSTIVRATKLNRTNPVSIAAATVVNPFDVGSISVFQESAGFPIYKEDQIGIFIIIPAVAEAPVNISEVSFCATFTVKPVLTFV